MKLEMFITDENGIVIVEAVVDTADLPNPTDLLHSAMIIMEHVERIADCEVTTHV